MHRVIVACEQHLKKEVAIAANTCRLMLRPCAHLVVHYLQTRADFVTDKGDAGGSGARGGSSALTALKSVGPDIALEGTSSEDCAPSIYIAPVEAVAPSSDVEGDRIGKVHCVIYWKPHMDLQKISAI